MDAYVYRATLYCENCATDIEQRLCASGVECPDISDSNDWPCGPYSDGGGEADSPQHCEACNVFLQNPLTNDGRDYVQDTLDNYRITPTVQQWADFYDINPTENEDA